MQNESTISATQMQRHGSSDSDGGNESTATVDIVNAVVDLATDNLPAVDTPDACDKAAVR